MRYPVETLQNFVLEVLTTVGIPITQAKAATEALLFADLRGIESHGISKLPIYVKRIGAGSINPQADPAVVSTYGAVARVDADNALGHVAGSFAADVAFELAEANGIGVSLVKNSNHFGITAYYSMKHIHEGVVGFALSNANPTMAPWGGKKALLGTNPLSFAIPTGDDVPIVLDMASTTVARGKIISYAQAGKELPAGWALDAEGNETRDPEVALKGLLAPLGGAKGSGLSMIVDLLCGILTQSKYLDKIGPLYTNIEEPQGVGHVIGVIDPRTFMLEEEFLGITKRYLDEVRQCPPASGVERVLVPGEIEYNMSVQALSDGVPLSEATVSALRDMAVGIGLDDSGLKPS